MSEHLVDAERPVVHVALEPGEPPDEHAAQPREGADRAQVGQHPVDAVEVLVDVLENQQRAVEVREVGRVPMRHCSRVRLPPASGPSATPPRMT